MEQRIIDQVAALGFDVWMRNVKDTWLHFTDGSNIGYLQHDPMSGYNISTVHKPNTATGTGFQVERYEPSITRDMLLKAFVHCPQWANRDAASVHKYKNMEDYRAASRFNAGYRLVAKAVQS